jgi:hypothetical protein
MTWITPILLFQSLLSLPPLGFVRSPSGLTTLHGMRANFVLGEPLPVEVLSAARFQRIEVWKLANEVRILAGAEYTIPTDGPAYFAADIESEAIYVWLPKSQEIIRWTAEELHRSSIAGPEGETTAVGFVRPGRLQLISRLANGVSISTIDARSLLLINASVIPEASHAALDTKGNQWLARGSVLSCGARQWTFDSLITSLAALDRGWMLVGTDGGNRATRCELDTLTAIPQAESLQ